MSSRTLLLSVRLALVGIVIQFLGFSVAIYFFNQVNGVTYSPLNHFVSELTAPTLSPKAWLMSLTLTVGCFLYLPSFWALAAHLRGWMAYLAFLSGVVGTLAVGALGFFPMENLIPHLIAASIFFWSWLVTVFLFGLAFWRRFGFRASPFFVLTSAASLLTSGAFLAVLYSSRSLRRLSPAPFDPANIMELLRTFKRPVIWDLTVLEWSVVLFVTVWVIANSAYLHRLASARK